MKCEYYNAALAASLLSLLFQCLSVRPGTAAPVSPVALLPAKIYIPPSRKAQAAPTRHTQNKVVCATLSLIILILYVVLAQWHRQKPTYCTPARARVCYRSYLLILLFLLLRKLIVPLCLACRAVDFRLCRPCVPVCAIVPNHLGGR